MNKKKKTFNKIVLSIISYNSNVWTLKGDIRAKLMRSEIDFCNVSRVFRKKTVINEVIKDGMNV